MTHSRRRDVLKAAGTVAIVGGLAGCAGGEEQQGEIEETQQNGEGMGAIRFAHTSPDAPNVDVLVDDEPVIEDLAFREVSPYEELEPGAYQVQVTATEDQETIVFDEEIEVQEGVSNTAVAYGEASGGPDAGLTVEVLEDDLTDPGDDMSRVRLFHASPDADDVDVVVTQAPEGDGGEADGDQQPDNGQQEGEEPQETQQEGEQQPEDEQPPEDGQPEDGQPSDQPQQDDVLFEGVSFGDSDSQEVPAGDYSLGVVPAGNGEQQPENGQPSENGEQPEDEQPPEDEPTQALQEEEPPEGEQPPENGGGPPEDEQPPENGDGPPEDGQPTETPVAEFDLTAESQTVYSAFAVGYVSPEAAPVDEEFEIVTVEDAQAGERAEGGTDGDEDTNGEEDTNSEEDDELLSVAR